MKTNPSGRPTGSRSISKFEPMRPEIENLLRAKVSISAIARLLNVSRPALYSYIVTRQVRENLEEGGAE